MGPGQSRRKKNRTTKSHAWCAVTTDHETAENDALHRHTRPAHGPNEMHTKCATTTTTTTERRPVGDRIRIRKTVPRPRETLGGLREGVCKFNLFSAFFRLVHVRSPVTRVSRCWGCFGKHGKNSIRLFNNNTIFLCIPTRGAITVLLGGGSSPCTSYASSTNNQPYTYRLVMWTDTNLAIFFRFFEEWAIFVLVISYAGATS